MPDAVLDVFDHQRFRLRTPEGLRVAKSFKEILTEPDAAYAFDYAQPFYDVAAFNLLTFLAQLAFEPETPAQLAGLVEAPLSEADFERAVAPLRQRCALTGEGPRFMQAPAPEDPKKADPLSVAVFIAPKGDRQFLHRSDEEWAVAPEQAGLFLFARNTFYEGTGGRGYQKGTNGDTPIRSLVVLPEPGGTISLRRSVWLNVLCRQKQRTYAGAYADPTALRPGEYDGLFWADPPSDDVPVGGITLRAGLGWMTAYHWLWFEEDAEGVCPLTGERVEGRAARTLSKRSTGISYGTKGDLDGGTRASRLFRHPNVPTARRYDKKGDPTGEEDPFLVSRTEGLVNALGASFFGGLTESASARYTLAPAAAQLYADALRRVAPDPALRVFGFHMLSAQKNVHGGIEQSAYVPFERVTEGEDPEAVMQMASEIVWAAAQMASASALKLKQAVQRTAGAGVRAELDPTSGRLTLNRKLEKTPSVDDPYGRDVLARYWDAAGGHVLEHVSAVAEVARRGPEVLADEAEALENRWKETIRTEVWRQYAPVFEHYSTLPRTMPYAYAARKMLASALKK